MKSRIHTLAIVAALSVFFGASAIADPILNFDQVVDSGTVAHVAGGVVTGTGIGFETVTISGAPMNNGLWVCTACVLNFTSGALVTEGSPDNGDNWAWGAGGSFTVTGAILGLGINAPVTLLSGQFAGPDTIAFNFGSQLQITGFGIDEKHPDLLAAMGTNNPDFIFADNSISVGATIEADGSFSGNVTNADLTNTAVPIPGTSLLMLLGLGGVALARRKAK
jgi:hypothetical protein